MKSHMSISLSFLLIGHGLFGCRFGGTPLNQVNQQTDLSPQQIENAGLNMMDISSSQEENVPAQDMSIRMDIEREDQVMLPLEPPVIDCRGAWACLAGEGCLDERCGACLESADCQEGEVCHADGHCGTCDEGNQCNSDQICIDHKCLPNDMRRLNLIVNAEEFRTLRANPYDRDRVIPCVIETLDRSNMPIDRFGDETDCRVNIHGGSSRDYSKPSLRIKFDKDGASASWGRAMTLRAEYNDKSYIRNFLGIRLFKALTRIPISRSRYVWLTVNGAPFGLFHEIERVDQEMLPRWNRDPQAPLFEADPSLDLFSQGATALVPLDTYERYTQVYDLKAGVSWAPLISWIEDDIIKDHDLWVDENPQMPHLSQSLIWGHYIDYLAIMTLLQNHDHIRKNYYLSLQSITDEERPRWEIYPWDLDLSWGCLYNNDTGDTLCDSLITDRDPLFGMMPEGVYASYPTDGFYNLLMHLVLSQPEARRAYNRKVCAMLDSETWRVQIPQWISALTVYLRPWVERDERGRVENVEDFERSVDEVLTFMRDREAYLRDHFGCE